MIRKSEQTIRRTPTNAKSNIIVFCTAIFCLIIIFSSCAKEKGDKISVSLKIETETEILAETELTALENDTPFDILKKYCEESETELKYGGFGGSVYILGIFGLNEFDDGPSSGWIYLVNGEFANRGAGNYPLQDGDSIVFRYVTEFYTS